MDESLIVEFSSVTDAQTSLDSINAQILQLLQGDGYTVIDNAVIGKNAATGQDDPTAVKTSTWAIIQQSPDNTFYFSSPHNDLRFENVTIINGVEKTLLLAWQQTDDV